MRCWAIPTVRLAYAVTNSYWEPYVRTVVSDKSGQKSAIFATRRTALPRPVNPITTKVVFTDGSSGIYLPDIPVGSATGSR